MMGEENSEIEKKYCLEAIMQASCIPCPKFANIAYALFERNPESKALIEKAGRFQRNMSLGLKLMGIGTGIAAGAVGISYLGLPEEKFREMLSYIASYWGVGVAFPSVLSLLTFYLISDNAASRAVKLVPLRNLAYRCECLKEKTIKEECR